MIEDALARMETAWGQILPSSGVDLAVHVEPVEVHWVLPAEAGQPAPVIDETEMRDYIESAVRQGVAQPDSEGPGEYLLRISMAVDMHRPDELLLQIRTSIGPQNDPHQILAVGDSGCLQLARLYCHGCHESWGDKGSDLRPSEVHGGGGGGVFFSAHGGGGSHGGYSKH